MANSVRQASVVVVMLAVASVSAWAQKAAQDDPVSVVETFIRANERADLDLIMSTFDAAATLFSPGDRPQRADGAAEIRATFAGLFAQRRGPITITPRDVQVQRFGDIAVVTAHLGPLPALPVTEPATFSRRTFVVKRVGNHWAIVHLHASNFPLLPADPAPSAQGPRPPETALSRLPVFEREIEMAAARGDVAFLEGAIADDFTFTHGDAWRTGGAPALVDTKASWLRTVGRGFFVSRQVDTQQVEAHDGMAVTTGRILVTLKPPLLNAGKAEYSVWFVRVYRATAAGWQLVSHRTVAEG